MDEYGKKFEKRFALDFSKIPNSFVMRLNDQMSEFKMTSKNISDFVCYSYPYMFCIECKVRKGNTFSLTTFSQLDSMQQTVGKKGLLCGVLIWFIDHDKICFCDIDNINNLIAKCKKSINVKMIDDNESGVYSIKSVKKKSRNMD